MSKKRNNKESTICLTPKPSQNFFVNCIQGKHNFFPKKSIFKGRGEWRIEPKNEKKKGFLTAHAMAIKKDPTTSIRKHANELKVHEKTEESY